MGTPPYIPERGEAKFECLSTPTKNSMKLDKFNHTPFYSDIQLEKHPYI